MDVGDGYCDDLYNNEVCNFDAGKKIVLCFLQYLSLSIKDLLGDCCKPFIKSHYCSDCICHEDGTRHPDHEPVTMIDPLTIPTTSWPDLPTCRGSGFYVGNGYCDDFYNTKACYYDGGKNA